MDITVAIWKTPAENSADFVEATNRHDGLTFETVMPGGFGTCSFHVGVGGWNAIRWYRDFVGYHLVLFDHLGRRLYEGRIDSTNADVNGVSVNAVGYYAHAGDLTHGIIYPATTPKSISDIIKDTVALATGWWDDTSQIKTTVTDITPQDFTGEKKLNEAIEAVLKFGDDGINPVPLYFAIWEHRRAHLFAEPAITSEPAWQVYVKDFGSGTGLSLSRNRTNLFNKIQILFDDPDIGATFALGPNLDGWFQDLRSQQLFGVREGSMNIGSSLPAVADVMGALAIKSYAWPTQSSTLAVSSRVYTRAGAPDFPYVIRAGALVRINDFDPTVSQLVESETGKDTSVSLISRTSYSADTNELSMELGRQNVALDILMARLGMSSGSVR